MGHRGIATSFYTEDDSPMASVLTRTLLETGQDIPEFLQAYVPEEGKDLKFEADSDWEEEGGDAAGGDDGFGGAGGDDAGWD